MGFKLVIETERPHTVGMLPSYAKEMLNARRKWREKTRNTAENGIFMFKARFSSHALLEMRERSS